MAQKRLFTDYPLSAWLFGVFFLAFSWVPDQGWVFGLVGLGFIAIPSVLTVTVDEEHETLDVSHRSLLRRSSRSFPMRDIAFVNVPEDSDGDGLYRVELELHSGERVPLRGFFSIGKRGKQRLARLIRDAMP